MKHIIVLLILCIFFCGIYNISLLQNSTIGFFGDRLYEKKDFLNAKKYYTDLSKNTSLPATLRADVLYNIGNTLYKLGEQEKDGTRIQLWKESIDSYTISLSIRTDSETEENLSFVREQLQKEEKQEQEKSNTDSGTIEQTSNSGGIIGSEGEIKESGEKSEVGNEKNQSQSEKKWSNGGNYNSIGGQNTSNDTFPLSDSNKEDIQKYLEGLKQFEKQNGKLLNPEKSGQAGSISDQIRDFFGNDSFFQDVLPTNDGKKDW